MADNESNSSNIDVAAQEQLINAPSERSMSETISLAAKFTAEHLMRHCPYTVAFEYIDTSLWGIPVPEDADKKHVTTWVAKAIRDYHEGTEWDEALYFDYQWEFEGWTRELFQKVDRNTLKSLKTILRHRGVYTGNLRSRVADSLFNLLGGENPPEWDPVEFQATKFDERSEAYKRQQSAHQVAPVDIQQPQPQPSQQPQPQLPQQLPPQPQRPPQDERQCDQQNDRQREQYGVRQDVRSHSQYQQRLQTQIQAPATTYRDPTPLPHTYREVTPFPQQPTNRVPDRIPDPPHDPYKTLPPRWSRNDRLDANTITQFSKLWDNSNKYTGNAYDLLDDKIKVFFSICWQVDIQEEQFHAVFPRILTGRAETFYIQVVERGDSFADAYMAIKNHFDHDVHHQHYYTDWTTTTFARTRAENPEKGLHEVLQILLDKL